MRPVTATIRPESPPYRDWLRVFGTDQVPIMLPYPVRGSAPGVESAEFYKLHVPSLTPDQRSRLVEFIAERFGELPSTVEALMDDPEHGVPIKAEDVLVSVDARAFL